VIGDNPDYYMPLTKTHAGVDNTFWAQGYGVVDHAGNDGDIGRISNQFDTINETTSSVWSASVNAGRGAGCLGDSGGAGVNYDKTPYAQGVAFGLYTLFSGGSDNCPGHGGWVTYTRPEVHIDFINNSLIDGESPTCAQGFSYPWWQVYTCW
jgi:hypothetical protein